MEKKKNIILGITGSIAAYKACDLIGALRKSGYDVTCVLTKEAGYFVTPLTLETLSGNKVLSDMFELPENRIPSHTSLADRASLIAVCPASANVIGKLASGICDDLLTCAIFASKAPVLLAPAMNDNMYNHPIVQSNIEILKKNGMKFVSPVKGRLACGREGVGHIADIKDIVDECKKLAK